LLSIAPDPSPMKRKRVAREDDYEVVNGKTPRKEKTTDIVANKPRQPGRKKCVYICILYYSY
jgi:inhibitor of growth protein 3